MRHLVVLFAAATALACAPKPEAAPAADSAAPAAPAAAPAGPRAIITVLYNAPKDPKAFEAYYPTHLKIVGDKQQEIGFLSAELTKFTTTPDGTSPPFYRQAELVFANLDAAKAGMATPGFKAVGDDFANFATGGIVALIAEETGTASSETCPALVTVIYNLPKDSAAFEAYYPKHLEIVSKGQAEIGFTRADLTKFISALDGSPSPKYRQAELCFPNAEARAKGLATKAFADVGADFPNFATGGLVAILGDQAN